MRDEPEAVGGQSSPSASALRRALEGVDRLQCRLTARYGGSQLVTPRLMWAAVLWVVVSIPFTTATAVLFVDSPGSYVFVFVFMASGAYTLPALVAAWYAVRRAPERDRMSFALLATGLALVFSIGVAMLVGQATGWTWGNGTGVVAVLAAGLVHMAGLAKLLHSRSGRRAFSVDLVEAAMVVVALTAPMVVLWGEAVVEAEHAWWAVPAAVVVPFALWGTYLGVILVVRLGPGHGPFEVSAVALASVGLLNTVLQTAQGVAGFTLPVAPLIAVHAVCMSQYLMIPLTVPQLLRSGLGRLPPQAQVRGTRLPTVLATVGVAGLLAATWAVADERSWVVPFALAVVVTLFVLGGLRHIASLGETLRLYRQVEEASEQRRHLLSQLVARSVDERRDFAGRLYEQAVAAYVSFRTVAGAEHLGPNGSPGHRLVDGAVAQASARIGGDLARQADAVREVMLALRPLADQQQRPQRLVTPITAYLASTYGDRTPPRLVITMDDALTLDWVVETMLLQIVQEALHNVWRHSEASRVDLSVELAADSIVLRVTDDGVGFDPATVPEGSGIATMRASAAVVGGTVVVDAVPGVGTTVTAHLGLSPGAPAPTSSGDDAVAVAPSGPPQLRLLRGGDDGSAE